MDANSVFNYVLNFGLVTVMAVTGVVALIVYCMVWDKDTGYMAYFLTGMMMFVFIQAELDHLFDFRWLSIVCAAMVTGLAMYLVRKIPHLIAPTLVVFVMYVVSKYVVLGNNATMWTLSILIFSGTAAICLRHQLDTVARVLFISLATSWIMVYTVLYFISESRNSLVDVSFDIKHIKECYNTPACRLHYVYVIVATVLRMFVVTVVYKREEDRRRQQQQQQQQIVMMVHPPPIPVEDVVVLPHKKQKKKKKKERLPPAAEKARLLPPSDESEWV